MIAGGTGPLTRARFKLVRNLSGRVPNAKNVDSGHEARGPAAREHKIRSHPARKKKVHWPVLLFLIALLVPWTIFIGPLRMSLYRFVLLAMILPCLGMWLAGRAGRIRTTDLALLLFWFWCTLSVVV